MKLTMGSAIYPDVEAPLVVGEAITLRLVVHVVAVEDRIYHGSHVRVALCDVLEIGPDDEATPSPAVSSGVDDRTSSRSIPTSTARRSPQS